MNEQVLKPEDMILRVAKALSHQDLDELMSFYEPEAILVKPDGTQACGVEAIREEYSAYIGKVVSMTASVTWCHVTNEIATVRGHYEIAFKRRDGTTVIRTGEPIETLRKQADGSWLYLIDNGSGADPIQASDLAAK